MGEEFNKKIGLDQRGVRSRPEKGAFVRGLGGIGTLMLIVNAMRMPRWRAA